jgi:hypothetical protein
MISNDCCNGCGQVEPSAAAAEFGRMIYMRGDPQTGRSAVWLARLAWDQEVSGSNPLAPIARDGADVRHWLQVVDGQLGCHNY